MHGFQPRFKAESKLLTGYSVEIFRSKCHPDQDVLHCHARLDNDISEALPYIHAELGADTFCADPPALTFRWHGKLVTLHSKLIAINALRNEAEAHAILRILKDEINAIWEKRDALTPCYSVPKPPQVVQILKHLPKTNCKDCAYPTCMVFAIHLIEGVKNASDCPHLDITQLQTIEQHLFRWG